MTKTAEKKINLNIRKELAYLVAISGSLLTNYHKLKPLERVNFTDILAHRIFDLQQYTIDSLSIKEKKIK